MKRALIVAGLLLLAAGVGAQSPPGEPWACSLDGVDTTLTVCKYHPTLGKRLYITNIVAQSTTATAGQFLLQYGTGTACATGTASLFPSAASAVRIGYPANTAAPTVLSFRTPLIVPDGNDLCVLAVATNTLAIQMTGYIAP